MAESNYLSQRIASLEKELLKISRENQRLRMQKISPIRESKNKKTQNESEQNQQNSIEITNRFNLLEDNK